MKKVLAITTINNTISLKEALNKIKDKYGNIVPASPFGSSLYKRGLMQVLFPSLP